MKMLSGLLSRKAAATDTDAEVEATQTAPAAAPVPPSQAEAVDRPNAIPEPEDTALEALNQQAITSVMKNFGRPATEPLNIWDLDDDDEAPPIAETPAPAARPPRAEGSRPDGADRSGADAGSDDTDTTVPQETGLFPVGWLVVVAGPGRGTCLALSAGIAQIGRAEGQAIRLDFGDTSISRTNHAVIAYDDESREFVLGPGGKTKVVRLNGTRLKSDEELGDGDRITIGATTLLLKTLCGPDFAWSDDGAEDGGPGESDDASFD